MSSDDPNLLVVHRTKADGEARGHREYRGFNSKPVAEGPDGVFDSIGGRSAFVEGDGDPDQKSMFQFARLRGRGFVLVALVRTAHVVESSDDRP